jgi:hypothetical protein
LYPFLLFRGERVRFLLRAGRLSHDALLDLAHLAQRQRAPRAGREVVKINRPDARPNEAQHRMPDGFHHAPNLAVSPFADRQLDDPASFNPAAPDLSDLGRGRILAAPDIQAAGEGLQRLVGERALDRTEVRLAHRL